MPSNKTFTWDDKKEPHYERRKVIMREVPAVKSLFGTDPLLKYKTLFLVVIQLLTPLFLPENVWVSALILFLLGATVSHVLFLAIHEITHDLAFRKKNHNNILAIIANIPLVVPYAMAFRIYHAEHHWHQGKDGVDTDIPAEKEALIFNGFFGKLIWLINQILFYAFRPLVVHPIKIDKWQTINFVVQVTCMAAYYFIVGFEGILYLLLSLFIAGGLHPIAGHFIAEHYIFKEGQETYSYYGFLNKITFNVGYHNEHHDFPNIPGSRLPRLREMASGHYDQLYHHTSWVKVLWYFVTDASINLFSRVKRKN